MRKYWWTVWIKVAVLAVVLFLGYRFVSRQVTDFFSPYLIEEETAVTDETVEEETEGNFVMDLLGKVEDAFGVKIDFENMLFDYANEYAHEMKEQSNEERNPISEPLE